MRRWILVAFLLFAVAIPAFLLLRKKQRDSDLDRYLAGAGFAETDCPPAREAFGHADMNAVRCFAGKLAGGAPIRLLLGTRWQSETANVPKGSGVAEDSFIGVEVARADDAWVARWRDRLGLRRGCSRTSRERGGQDGDRLARLVHPRARG